MDVEEQLVEELVFEVLERRAAGELGALESVCAAHPAEAAEVRRRVESLASGGFLDVRDDSALPERLGEFQLVRRLGEGGMGVVLLARQPALGRDVALKVIRPEHLFFRGVRARFRREVEAVARLSHPGIVSVYTVGEDNGIPYFAMELIEGASLSEVLTHLRGRDPTRLSGKDLREAVVHVCAERGYSTPERGAEDPLFANSWPDACAWLVREVAQALEHAHQRGVLHRDVKPSNVLLTPTGRVVLVDFGLAAKEGAENITAQGAQLGSLAYMAPEQIAGDAASIGPRTDVYALGVLFYELLSLRPAFSGRDASEIGRHISSGRVESLRSRNEALAADVRTVCTSAMDVDPARRYASAADVARDLTHLLERRPIEARSLGLGLALRRWAQRQPALATALGLGLSAAIVVPALFAAQEVRARRVIALERDAARANLDLALEAIESTLVRVGSRDLRDVPRVDGLRRDLLKRATELYDRLGSPSEDDLRGRLRAARVLGRLASVRRDSGDSEGALRDFAEAEARLRTMLQQHPEHAEVLFELGSVLSFATMLRHLSQPREALAAFEETLGFLRKSVALAPAHRKARIELSRGLLGAAHFFDAAGERDQSRAHYEEALTLAVALREQDRADPEALELWASAQGRLADSDRAEGNDVEAQTRFELLLSETSNLESTSGYLRQLRSLSQQMLARIAGEGEQGERDPRIDQLLEGSYAELAELARDYPSMDSYSSALGSNWSDRGDRARRFGDLAKARECYESGLRTHLGVIERSPQVNRYWRNIGLTRHRLAEVCWLLGDRERAADEADASLEALQHAARVGRLDDVRIDLGQVLRTRVEFAGQLGDFERTVQAARGFLEVLPGSVQPLFDAARSFHYAMQVGFDAGEESAARALLPELAGLLRKILELDASRRADVAQLVRDFGGESEPEFADFVRE